ncbi:MAG: endonuclease/exonuclease/phosphatase family protein [Bacteroidetes bacterium]|nr:endonuclease/exonuclease/phosphatase family protein [Bacteroidota bacterium]
MSYHSLRTFTKAIIVGSNIVVVIVFLLGCYASWFNPKQFWFIGLFTLATLYLLIIIIGFFIFWLFVKRRFAWISLLGIVLAWKPFLQVFSLRWPAPFTLVKHPANIRVMSWNVEHFDILEHKTHPERKQEMIDLINHYQPDICCFQEMVASDSFPSAINYLPDMAAKMNMQRYFYSYNRKLDFDNKHRFGIIIFSKYPIVSQHTISYYPNDYNSIFQYIDILKDSDTIRVFNIHLQSLRFSESNLKYIDDPTLKNQDDIKKSESILSKFKTGFLKRQLQSEHIKQALDSSPYPVIICGDFNDVPNSYAYCTIGKGLKNAFVEKGSGIGRTFSGISPTLHIDNIFMDKKFNVEQFVIVKKKLSDHFPVITDLFYKKTNE